MALIQKIRNKSGLVLVLMILAIAAFIGMLITQDSNRSWGQVTNTTTVAEVGGKKLDYLEMDQKLEALYQSKGDASLRNNYITTFIESAVIEAEAAKAGLGVSKDELLDLEFGQNLSPVISSNPMFFNRQTRAVDIDQLQQIKQSIQSNTLPLNGKLFWQEIENQIIYDRVQSKFDNLISKSITTPDWLVDESYKELTQPVDFAYVRVPFDRVEDKDVQLTDADYEKYISDNKARFTVDEETRTLEYVAFDVVPTSEDSAKLRTKIEGLKEGFQKAEKDSAFVLANNGSYADQYIKSDALNASIKDIFASAASGTVVGPYVDNKSFTLAKLVDRRSAPDSVKARHILIRPGADGAAGAKKVADSLRNILASNIAKWDTLNMQFNQDSVARQSNGELGDWITPDVNFVAAFRDHIFFKAGKGSIAVVETQFGAHVINITDVKGKVEPRYKVAYVAEPILPSTETDKKASYAAQDLVSSSKNLEELRKNAQAKGLPLSPSVPFRANDMQIGGLGQSSTVRQIVKWAYEASPGERSKNSFALSEQGESYTSRYVVAALKSVQPKGLLAVKDVKDQITPIVKNRKKGEILKGKITASDLNTVASQFSASVDTAVGVTFNVTNVPNLGPEMAVLGTIFTKEVGQVTKPVLGEAGVYVAQVLKKDVLTNSPVDKNILRQQVTMNFKQNTRFFLLRSLKKAADITDNRSKFL